MPANPEFIPVSEKNVVLIYETYRNDGEPDSPEIPFAELDEKNRTSWISGIQMISRIIAYDGNQIGFITIVKNSEGINFGFGLFPEFRGRKLMSIVIPFAVDLIRKQNGAERIFSATAVDNFSAIRTLEKAGFKFTGIIEMFKASYRQYEI